MLTHQRISYCLAKCLIDSMIFLEFTNEELLNPDIAIEMQESISFELNKLSDAEKCELKGLIKTISTEYMDEKINKYVISLPSNLGIA